MEITVHVPPDSVEIVSAIFLELGYGGVVIDDPAVVLRYASETHPDEWAVPLDGQISGPALVRGYLPFHEGCEQQLVELKGALGHLHLRPPGVSTRVVAEEDWANAWKAYYQPVRIGKRLVVKPSWLKFSPHEEDLVIEMDPGMAFGCGTHATTGMCLRLLEKYVRTGSCVFDVGTGSGILAIAAAMLGAGRVFAVDFDPVACRVAAENVGRNGLADKVEVLQGNLLDHVRERADLIVANIIAGVIVELAPAAVEALAPEGIFIASGIISERAPEVSKALEESGLAILQQVEEEQWVAFAAKKHASFNTGQA